MTEEAIYEFEMIVRSVRKKPQSLRKLVDKLVDEKMQKAMAK
jgi:hypothetical protein